MKSERISIGNVMSKFISKKVYHFSELDYGIDLPPEYLSLCQKCTTLMIKKFPLSYPTITYQAKLNQS